MIFSVLFLLYQRFGCKVKRPALTTPANILTQTLPGIFTPCCDGEGHLFAAGLVMQQALSSTGRILPASEHKSFTLLLFPVSQ